MAIVVLGFAVLNWLSRDAEGNTLRAIIITNLFVQVGGFALRGAEIVTRQLPGAAWPSVVAQAALSVVFGFALISTIPRNRRRGDNVLSDG